MKIKTFRKNTYLLTVRRVSILSAIFVLALLYGCNVGKGGEYVTIAEAGIKALEVNFEISGNLAPEEATKISTTMGGKVHTVNFEVGDVVQKGQTLIVLDTSEIDMMMDEAQRSRRSAQAKADVARAAMATAESDLHRMEALYEEGAIALIKVKQAQSGYDNAKAAYDKANKALNQAQTAVDGVMYQLAETNVKSPINGVIVSRNIKVGEVASPGVSIGTAADISKLKLVGTIEHDLFPFMEIGKTLNINVDRFPENFYEGTITLLGPVTVGSGNYYPIEVTIDNPGELMVGMAARTSTMITRDLGIVVPSSAIVKSKNQIFLYVVEGDIAYKRPVELGFSNGDDVEIVKGVRQGEMVAVTNVGKLKDNMQVIILEE